MKAIITALCTMLAVITIAQPSVKVELSADTVMMGELVELTYTIENGQGKFTQPDLTGLPIVSGPNSSTSMVYENGKMSTSQSYSYILRPERTGQLVIPPTTYVTGADTITLQPLTVVVDKYFPVEPPGQSKTTNGVVREKKKF
jgi:hypothetical protein